MKKPPISKKEIEPGKFKKYVEEVGDVDPDQKKRRRRPQEQETFQFSSDFQKTVEKAARDVTKSAPKKKSEKSFSKDKESVQKEDKTTKETEKSKATKKKYVEKGMGGRKLLEPIEEEKPQEGVFSLFEKKEKKLVDKKEPLGAKEMPPIPTKEIEKETATKKKMIEKGKEPITPTAKPLKKEKVGMAPKIPKELKKKIEPKKSILPTPIEKKEKKTLPKEATKRDDLQVVLPTSHEIETASIQQATPLPPTLPSAEIFRLFQHMVSQITQVIQKGESFTTITLSGPAFRDSVFYGSQIVIKESSTAQKVYNIELRGATAKAQTLFEMNAGSLLETFQKKKLPFSVHRIETGLVTKRAVKRKKREE